MKARNTIRKGLPTLSRCLVFGALFLLVPACEDPNFDREINASSIDDLISQVGVLGAPAPASLVEVGAVEDSTTTDSNGTKYNCSAKEFELNSVFKTLTLSAFDDRAATNTASLYPGSIIKLQDFTNLDELNGIGTYERQPIQISSTLGDIRPVEDPAQRGNVDKQIKDMENQQGDFAANLKFETTESYSMEQSMFELGINGSYLGNSVKSKFRVESTVEKKNVFIKFLQVYHTVSVANPIRPSDFFGPSVTTDDLKSVTGTNQPLGFISEVAYGRVLVGKFSYSGSKFKTAAELDVEIQKGLGKIEVGAEYENEKEFTNSTFEVAILGGSAEEASQVSGTGMEAVRAAYNFIKNGGSDPSLGVPVQYKIKHLADNSTVATGGVAKYEVPDCNFVATNVVLKTVRLVNMPTRRRVDGADRRWDSGSVSPHWHPDPYFIMTAGSSTLMTSNILSNIDPEKQLPKEYSGKSIQRDANSSIKILFKDSDNNTDDTIGSVTINFSEFTDAPPATIRVQNGQMIVEVDVDWN